MTNHNELNGTVFGHSMERSSWNEVTKRIEFAETITIGFNSTVSYSYSGFFHNICAIVTPPSGNCEILTGSVAAKSTGQPQKQEFGWVAIYSSPLVP